MSGVIPAHDLFIFFGFIAVGAWLERVGVMRDWADRFLTPIPLGLSAVAIIAVELALA